MNCPYCGFFVQDAYTIQCPRCGQQLTNSAGGPGMATDAFSESPTVFSSQPPLPEPPRASSGVAGGNAYSPYPSQSMPGSAPMYRPGGPSSYPPMQPPGGIAPMPPIPASPRKSRSGLIIGILIVLVVLLASGLGASLYALNARSQQGQTGGTTSTSTAAPSPTSTPNEVVLFQDPLTSNTNQWANDANQSHCFFKDKSYHVKDSYYCLAPAGSITDATITVQVKQLVGSTLYPYGIVFRRSSPGNWYEFDIDSNSKWVFWAVINNTFSKLVPYTPNGAIKGGLNQVNTLSVQIKGTHFTFFVNGTKVGEAADTIFLSGYCGLSAGGADTEVAYNNFQITAVS